MKLPLLDRPFAPLQLSRAQCDAHGRMAMAVVRECIAEFDEFTEQQHRTVDLKCWKNVKTMENVTVYKQLEGAAATASTSTWSMPKLLGVGSMVGGFDDVLYGVLSPDVTSMQVNTAYTKDEIVDCDVLATIQSGTLENPLRFVGIKWLAKVTPSVSLVSPRDLTIVDATGVYVDAKGQRYGYHLMHSVDLPQCPSLAHLGIVRGKISSCFLFKSKPNDRSVEIFMTSLVDPGGNLRAAVAIPSAVNSLLGFAKAVYTAEKKKFAWLLRQAFLMARARRRGVAGIHIPIKTDDKGRQCCALCIRPFSTFRSRVGCELCHSVVCSRCETTRKIVTVEDGVVNKVTRPLCKTCITTVSTMSAADFAKCEYVPGGMMGSHEVEGSRDHGKLLNAAESDLHSSLVSTERSSGATSMSFGSSIDEMPPTVDEDDETHAIVVRPTPTRPPPPAMPSLPSYQEQLWLQMQQLRIQAEQTYQLAALNNHVMADSMDPKSRSSRHI